MVKSSCQRGEKKEDREENNKEKMDKTYSN